MKIDQLHPSRPVRPRTPAQERSNVLRQVCGSDYRKADRVLAVPLFAVAMEGHRALKGRSAK